MSNIDLGKLDDLNKKKSKMVCLQGMMCVAPQFMVDDEYKSSYIEQVKDRLRAQAVESFRRWIETQDDIFVVEQDIAYKSTINIFVGDSRAVYESVFADIMKQLEASKQKQEEGEKDNG